MDNKQIENITKEDQEKIKQAVTKWSLFLFSKESDKHLFEYFLESLKKSNIITKYSTLFLEQCIIPSIIKMETVPMHHNMRLKQSFQFLLDNAIELNPSEDVFKLLFEKVISYQENRQYVSNRAYSRWDYFLQVGHHFSSKNNKNNDVIKFILEKICEKTNLETIFNHINKLNQENLEDLSPLFAQALIQKIENDSSLVEDIILNIYYIEDKKKQLCLMNALCLSPKMTNMNVLKECWDIYNSDEKQSIINKDLMGDNQNTALEKLSGYQDYLKNILLIDLEYQQIIRKSPTIKNKNKIDVYFSLLEQIYSDAQTDDEKEKVKDYTQEMYIKIIREKRPDLAKGLISIKVEKGIIQAEDVPLFVYEIMSNFQKITAYHLVNELLESVKKFGKVEDFTDVFNTGKRFEVRNYSFEFDETMKDEIKYIYYHYVTDKIKEESKNKMDKPRKINKI